MKQNTSIVFNVSTVGCKSLFSIIRNVGWFGAKTKEPPRGFNALVRDVSSFHDQRHLGLGSAENTLSLLLPSSTAWPSSTEKYVIAALTFQHGLALLD